MANDPETTSDAPRLLADVGGTNCRFALAHAGGIVRPLVRFGTREVAGPVEAVGRALAALPDGMARPTSVGLAIASPLVGDEVAMMNAGWRFSLRATSRALGMEVVLLNDFVAQAFALDRLDDDMLETVGPARVRGEGAKIVIGAGTGLGVGIALPTMDGVRVVPSEAGHATAAAYDADEDAVIAFARARYGHVSYERLVSGPGLEQIYEAWATLRGTTPTRKDAAAIGADDEPTAQDARRTFARLLGTIAADLALTVGATAGVYLTGGVIARLGPRFDAGAFRTRFEQKGRYDAWLARIPTYRIRDESTAFLGVARVLASLDARHPSEGVFVARP